jgi:UDP-galactopyranose mutase
MQFSTIIIGCGLSGVISANLLAERGEKVLVIEQRSHIGGNCYDSYNEHGVLVHNYGPHIFHTEYEDVWKYLSNFTDWIPYQHKVLGLVDGQYIPIPFNLNSLHMLYPPVLASRLEAKLVEKFGFGKKIPVLELQNSEDSDLQSLADYVYQKIYLGYTKKQWDLNPDEIDPAVTARVPLVISRDDRYFQDKYQAMPKYGYTRLIKKILEHPNIKVMLNTHMKDVCRLDQVEKRILLFEQEFQGKFIYSGRLDELFDYCYGMLPYRSLFFKWQTFEKEAYQHAAVLNYPENYDYTRVTEYKYLTGQNCQFTSISVEYSKSYKSIMDIPYYPILNLQNKSCHAQYAELCAMYPTIYCIGRLADYKYYNMDIIVKKCLELYNCNEKKIHNKA